MSRPDRLRRRPDHELLDDLRTVAQLVDRPPAVDAYNRLHTPGTHAGAATIVDRFGSWAAALDAAGLPPTGRRRWTDQELDQALARWAATTDDRRIKSYRALSADDPTWPSEVALKRRYGSWAGVAAAAVAD